MKNAPLSALSITAPRGATLYPAPFAEQVAGRLKRKLGDVFGLSHFGINLTQLAPGAVSALAHHHSKQDEFIYVLEGSPTLILGTEEHVLKPGDCCGFRAGSGVAHQLVNRSASEVTYLEVGDRSAGDRVEYPNDDLLLDHAPDGSMIVTHRDGRPY